MALTSDIGQTWRAHRQVVRRHMARGQSEAFLFTFLFVFLLLTFISLYPRAARIALENPDALLAPQLLGLALGLLATIPFFYGLAAFSHILARAFGAKGSWHGARLALFWSLVAVSPVIVLQGLTVGVLGFGAQSMLVGVIALTAFAVFWALALIEVYSKVDSDAV
jgi:hypothetical protein